LPGQGPLRSWFFPGVLQSGCVPPGRCGPEERLPEFDIPAASFREHWSDVQQSGVCGGWMHCPKAAILPAAKCEHLRPLPVGAPGLLCPQRAVSEWLLWMLSKVKYLWWHGMYLPFVNWWGIETYICKKLYKSSKIVHLLRGKMHLFLIIQWLLSQFPVN
jgi:hypothetical protein